MLGYVFGLKAQAIALFKILAILLIVTDIIDRCYPSYVHHFNEAHLGLVSTCVRMFLSAVAFIPSWIIGVYYTFTMGQDPVRAS